MQYLGGKVRIAKELAKVIRGLYPDRTFWDPFCGGLSMSLALGGDGLISDVSLPLVSLYRGVASGWTPPLSLSPEEYQAAKALPDTDPMKGFAGFGCSFGGKWWGGYATPTKSKRGTGAWHSNCPLQSRNAVLRDIPELIRRGCIFDHASFLDFTPGPWGGLIYCDPPYQGTTGYGAIGAFDHARFWSTCQAWAALGVPVFVSEYACPVPARVVWSKSIPVQLTGGTSAARGVEFLFQVQA